MKNHKKTYIVKKGLKTAKKLFGPALGCMKNPKAGKNTQQPPIQITGQKVIIAMIYQKRKGDGVVCIIPTKVQQRYLIPLKTKPILTYSSMDTNCLVLTT